VIIELPNNQSAFNIDLAIDDTQYVLKFRYNCIASRFYAALFNQDEQITTSVALTPDADLLKSVDFLVSLKYIDNKVPAYGELTGKLELLDI